VVVYRRWPELESMRMKKSRTSTGRAEEQHRLGEERRREERSIDWERRREEKSSDWERMREKSRVFFLVKRH
jgi:hypothetical protein